MLSLLTSQSAQPNDPFLLHSLRLEPPLPSTVQEIKPLEKGTNCKRPLQPNPKEEDLTIEKLKIESDEVMGLEPRDSPTWFRSAHFFNEEAFHVPPNSHNIGRKIEAVYPKIPRI